MIDYSALKYAKGTPKAADAEAKRDARAALDLAENRKARRRAAGRCEVRVKLGTFVFQCLRKDTQTHHLIGGIGRRNRGKSILADYKLRVCDDCHKDITGNVLQPTTAEHTHATVRYRRAR